ncbi:unnamed protein product [Arctia plantaginis]|uniref:Uncharacterized protein n=1 Tax=Arctia plantaginis TaxID=874455 RepID=A0A8S0ZPE7_ARCPL|nr:unnamed protein product [Arctia plantaginis]
MCIRRRKRDKKIQTGQQNKKKAGCASRCRQWFSRKIRRYIRKKIFGIPDPKFADYEILEANLDALRNKIKDLGTPTKNTMKLSNLNEKDIKLLQGMKENKLKKKFQLTDSNYKILTEMLRDYKEGKISLIDLSKKQKGLDEIRLNRILQKYNEAKRTRNLIDIKNSRNGTKNKEKFKSNERKTLNKLAEDLKKMIPLDFDPAKIKLDSTIANKSDIKRILSDYAAIEKGKKALLSILEKPNVDNIVSRRRILSLVQDLEKIRIT